MADTKNTEEWLIQSAWRRSGEVAFYSVDGRLTSVRREAKRYPSADEAYTAAEQLESAGQINEYTVLDVTKPDVRRGVQGVSGRA